MHFLLNICFLAYLALQPGSSGSQDVTGCTEGFTTNLPATGLYPTHAYLGFGDYFFPVLRFDCDGTITNISVATYFPPLQYFAPTLHFTLTIWHEEGGYYLLADSYQNSISLNGITVTQVAPPQYVSGLDAFYFTQGTLLRFGRNTNFPVPQGSILGLSLPHTSAIAQIDAPIALALNTTTTGEDRWRPYLSINFSPSSGSVPSTSSSNTMVDSDSCSSTVPSTATVTVTKVSIVTQSALTATSTSTVTVATTVAGVCSDTSATSLQQPVSSSLSSASDTSGDVTDSDQIVVQCTSTLDVAGNNAAAANSQTGNPGAVVMAVLLGILLAVALAVIASLIAVIVRDHRTGRYKIAAVDHRMNNSPVIYSTPGDAAVSNVHAQNPAYETVNDVQGHYETAGENGNPHDWLDASPNHTYNRLNHSSVSASGRGQGGGDTGADYESLGIDHCYVNSAPKS